MAGRASRPDRPKTPAIAPPTFNSDRLHFSRLRLEDADGVFERYASAVDVTRYVGWPRHQSVADTRGFVAFSDAAWARDSVGPYLLGLKTTGLLIGGTGLSVETGGRATTGYVLARDAWGQGYATEALGAMVTLAGTLGLKELQAFCHPQHRASLHVLDKCGFLRDERWRGEAEFPNLTPGVRVSTARYIRRA